MGRLARAAYLRSGVLYCVRHDVGAVDMSTVLIIVAAAYFHVAWLKLRELL